MPVVNYYEILGVSSKATDREIKRAYRRLIKRFHPDHLSCSHEATKIARLLNEAYEVCSNAGSRHVYDYNKTVNTDEPKVNKVAVFSSGYCMNNIWRKFRTRNDNGDK
jgi:DnaJ-class molecular chaperone